jgi:nucleoside phosphorylase
MVDFLLAAPTGTEWHAACALLESSVVVEASQPTKQGRVSRYDVVCMQLGKGIARAATNLTAAIHDCKPRWVILLGVAGGFTDKKVFRGDILVAEFVYGYEFGKLDAGEFAHRPDYDFHPDASLLAYAEALVEAPERQWLKRVLTPRPDKKDPICTNLHIGYVASGDKVVDDPSHTLFATMKQQLPKLHGIEMEGAGASAAIRQQQTREAIGFLMVRGISDEPGSGMSDGGTEQRKEWKTYAAACAAAFTAELIDRFPGKGVRLEVPAERTTDAVLANALEDLCADVKRSVLAAPWIRVEEERVSVTPVSKATRRALNLHPTASYKCEVVTRRGDVPCAADVTVCFRVQDVEKPTGVDFDLILGKGLIRDDLYDEICRGIDVERLQEYANVGLVRARVDGTSIDYNEHAPVFERGYFLLRFTCPTGVKGRRYDSLEITLSTFLHRSVGWYTYYTTNTVVDQLLLSFAAPFKVAAKINLEAHRVHAVENQRIGENYLSELTFDGPVKVGSSVDWIFLGGAMASSGKGSGSSGGSKSGGGKSGGGTGGRTSSGGGGVIRSGGGGVTSTTSGSGSKGGGKK